MLTLTPLHFIDFASATTVPTTLFSLRHSNGTGASSNRTTEIAIGFPVRRSNDIWNSTESGATKKDNGVILYVAQYPVRWPAQSALHFTPGRPVHSSTNSTSLGSIQPCCILHEDYSFTFPSLSTTRYSFIQLSGLRHRGENKNAKASNQPQSQFEPGLP